MSSVAVTPIARVALDVSSPAALRTQIESSLGAHLSSTLLLREGASPLTVSTGISTLDALTGGLSRGAMNEITGAVSSGRTGVMLAALAGATQRQEVCALVDASDSFDPASATVAGVDLDRLLWIRCHGDFRQKPNKRSRAQQGTGFASSTGFAFSNVLEQVLKITDLLLQGGGFSMVALDLGDIPVESARRIPLTSWFRFRRAVETTDTVLLVIAQEPCAKTCASLVVRLQPESIVTSNVFDEPQPVLKFPTQENGELREHSSFFSTMKKAVRNCESLESCLPHIPRSVFISHADLLRGMQIRAEVVRSRLQREQPQSTNAQFELRMAL
jgi:hypothetical protein